MKIKLLAINTINKKMMLAVYANRSISVPNNLNHQEQKKYKNKISLINLYQITIKKNFISKTHY